MAAKSFPSLFGSGAATSTVGMTNAQLATYYTQVFKVNGAPKTLAQAFCLALATYATDETLNTSVTDRPLAHSSGFNT